MGFLAQVPTKPTEGPVLAASHLLLVHGHLSIGSLPAASRRSTKHASPQKRRVRDEGGLGLAGPSPIFQGQVAALRALLVALLQNKLLAGLQGLSAVGCRPSGASPWRPSCGERILPSASSTKNAYKAEARATGPRAPRALKVFRWMVAVLLHPVWASRRVPVLNTAAHVSLAPSASAARASASRPRLG